MKFGNMRERGRCIPHDDRETCRHHHDETDGPGMGHRSGFGWGLGGGRRGRGEGRGGLGRLFAHGNLHLAALHLIAEKPRHGYEIIKVIEEMAGGSYSPSPGTIYPALSMLEDQGFVAVETSAGSRKLYTITADGQTYLENNKTAVDTLTAQIRLAARQNGGEPPPPVLRAMENLKLALRLKLASDTPDTERVQKIAAALDAAVAEIERS